MGWIKFRTPFLTVADRDHQRCIVATDRGFVPNSYVISIARYCGTDHSDLAMRRLQCFKLSDRRERFCDSFVTLLMPILPGIVVDK